jgi:hypothetical protein
MHKIFLILLTLLSTQIFGQQKMKTQVLVIGGGVGGTAAGIQSARMRVQTTIVEQSNWLGGMLTAAGVSATDGNNLLPSGMWEEFRQAMYKHYGKKNLASGWVSNFLFEPKVGDSILKAMAAKEKSLNVLYGWYFDKVLKVKNKVTGAVFVNKQNETLTVEATITIDATELGDAFADAGCAFDVGLEDAAKSGESMAPGKNNIIQDLTWAATLKDYGAGKDMTITRPANYDSTKYFCSCSDAPCNGKQYDGDKIKMLNYGKLPNGKFMLNWPPHGNDFYLNVIDTKPIDRENLYAPAKQQTLGFIYFMQTQLGMKNIGLYDEFGTEDKLAIMPYNREGRRVAGVVRLNVNHLIKPFDYSLYRTGISVGDYPIDHHHGQNAEAPKINFPGISSYNIPIGCIIPDKMDGLLVAEKGISVSNIVNGTTRLQPIVLLTGQAVGMLAAYAIIEKKQPRKISIRHLQYALLNRKCFLMPYVDVPLDSTYWQSIQVAGLTGLMRGVGKKEGWANRTYFYPDSIISHSEFENDLYSYDPALIKKFKPNTEMLTISAAVELLNTSMNNLMNTNNQLKHDIVSIDDLKEFWTTKFRLQNFDPNRLILRKELAVIIDKLYAPFFRTIDHQGRVSQ